jgi:hypothetical protein
LFWSGFVWHFGFSAENVPFQRFEFVFVWFDLAWFGRDGLVRLVWFGLFDLVWLNDLVCFDLFGLDWFGLAFLFSIARPGQTCPHAPPHCAGAPPLTAAPSQCPRMLSPQQFLQIARKLYIQ